MSGSLRRRLGTLEKRRALSTVVPLLIIFDGDDDLAIETRRRAWEQRYGDQIEAARKVGQIIFGLDFRLHNHRPEQVDP